jgi:CheY-like chemotaxis protein
MTSGNSSRKTVLFVDDDVQFLELLQPYMQRLSDGGWEVLVVGDSAGALRTLGSRPVDLAVLDVRMPVMDGVQLLHMINRKYPQLRKAVLSAHVDEECRSLAFNGAAELVLEKPREPAGYEALFAALNELVHLPVEQGFRGVLRRVGLEDIIQMECLSRHSLVLKVSAREQRASLYIRDGSLIHAEFGEVTGEAALQKLLTLVGGEFQHLPFAEPPRQTLEGSWEFLLLEAVRQRDEAAGAAAEQNEVAVAPAARETTVAPTSIPREVGAPLIDELVVCSERGEPLYAFQSEQPQLRCDWCMTLSQASARLKELLPIGALERVEFSTTVGRMIARFHEGHGIFLRANDGGR